MKIFINALSSRSGGAQKYIENILAHYDKSSNNQIFIVSPNNHSIPLNQKNILKIELSNYVGKNPFLRYIWEVVFLPRILINLQINVLFCPGGSFSGQLPINCKLVTTFQNMMPFDLDQRLKYPFGYMRFRNWLLQRKLMSSMLKSNLVIFISDFAKNVIENRAKNKIIHSVTIPHGIDPMFIRKLDNNLPFPEGFPQNFLLYVSTIDVYKAQVEVVKSYSLLKSRNPNAPKLIFIGEEYEPYGKIVRKLIEMYKLEDDILIKKAIPNQDLPSLYQHATINIFASKTENCPFILLEALASGRPLVVSNFPPMPEFGSDAVEYFDPSNPIELADLLDELLSNDNLLMKLSKNTLEHSKNFDWSVSAKRTWESINSL